MSEAINDSSKDNVTPEDLPPDRLHELGVLNRREIEARILGPVLEALSAEFGNF